MFMIPTYVIHVYYHNIIYKSWFTTILTSKTLDHTIEGQNTIDFYIKTELMISSIFFTFFSLPDPGNLT